MLRLRLLDFRRQGDRILPEFTIVLTQARLALYLGELSDDLAVAIRSATLFKSEYAKAKANDKSRWCKNSAEPFTDRLQICNGQQFELTQLRTALDAYQTAVRNLPAMKCVPSPDLDAVNSLVEWINQHSLPAVRKMMACSHGAFEHKTASSSSETDDSESDD